MLLAMNIKYLIIALVFFMFLLLSFYLHKQNLSITEISGEFRVNKVVKFGPIVNANGTNVLIKSKESFFIGDILDIKCRQINKTNDSPLAFASNFLKSKNVSLVANNAIIVLKQPSQTPLSFIQKFLDKGHYFKKVEPTILLGVLEKDSEIRQSAINMGIVHLIVISGLHVMLLQKAITSIVGKFISNRKCVILISFIPIIIYSVILNMPFPLVRAIIFSFITFLNKYYWKKRFDSLTILAITIMLVVLFVPHQIFSLSFAFTLISLFTIFCLSNLPIKNKYFKTFVITLAIFAATTPLIIFINGKIIILS